MPALQANAEPFGSSWPAGRVEGERLDAEISGLLNENKPLDERLV